MTIKKIGISLVAAMAMSSLYANGTLSTASGVDAFSTELISKQSVEHNLTSKLIYTCGIENATASEAGFELKLVSPAEFAGVDDAIADTLGVYNNENVKVASFDRYDATAHSIIFKAEPDSRISRGLPYVIGTDDNDTTADNADGLLMKLVKGTTNVVGELIVTDNTGVNVIDTAKSPIMEGKNQFAVTVDRKFDARINAANSFMTFFDRGIDNVTDDADITVTNLKDDLAISASAAEIRVDVVADQNLSEYKITSNVNGNALVDTVDPLTDFNQTLKATLDSNGSDNITITYNTDQSAALKVTRFATTAVVTFGEDDEHKKDYTATILSAEDTGAWTIYGYNAQIPSVASTSAVDVVFKFTNRSSIDTGIYFTLIDQDGTIVNLNSVDNADAIPALPTNTTAKYKASTLVDLITDPEFDKTKSFSVEVSIPTTPDQVYGSAVSNYTDGARKTLPIYNSSNMTF